MNLLRTDSSHPDFLHLVSLLDQDLAVRDGSEHTFYAQFNTLTKMQHTLLAFLEDKAVACGAIRALGPGTVEVKRMFVLPEYRGKGLAAAVLSELECWASELGFQRCVLETGKKQPEAIGLYQKCGYAAIPNYGPYEGVENSVCMGKNLTGIEKPENL